MNFVESFTQKLFHAHYGLKPSANEFLDDLLYLSSNLGGYPEVQEFLTTLYVESQDIKNHSLLDYIHKIKGSTVEFVEPSSQVIAMVAEDYFIFSRNPIMIILAEAIEEFY